MSHVAPIFESTLFVIIYYRIPTYTGNTRDGRWIKKIIVKTGRRTGGGATPSARARWRSADAEVGAGSRGGAGGKREIHTRSISVQNGEDGRRTRGRRRRSTGQGRDDRHAGRGNTTRDTTGSGSHGRGTGGQRSDIGSLVGPGTYSKQKRKRAMYKREQAGTQKNVRAGADKGWSPDISDRAGSTVTSRCV
jgi:hypothetical protein